VVLLTVAVGRILVRLRRSKNLDSTDTCVFGSVFERSSDLEHAIFVRELDLGSGGLLDAVAVVEVQFSAGFAVTVGRDNQVERLGADSGGGESALGAKRDDSAATDVEWDFSEIDVVESDLGAFALDDLPSVECVKAVVRKVDGDASAVLFCDGRDEDVGAVEELQSIAEDLRVVRVGEEEWVDQRSAVDSLLVESGVDVVEQAVADVVGVASGFCDGLPEVEFLRDGGVSIVVARERVEGCGCG
jgi:hypothetical protein